MNKDCNIEELAYESESGGKIVRLSDVQDWLTDKKVIKKGLHPHPYADVLHEWIEDRKVEVYNRLHENWTDVGKCCIYNYEYRIKPSEPIYEYLWLDLISPDTYGAPTSRYMTHNEAFEYFKHSKTYICVKETERDRR